MQIALFELNKSHVFDPEIAEWWEIKPRPLSNLAKRWFQKIKGYAPDIRETIHDGFPAACIDRFPFAYVDSFKSHVNMGFYYGAFLPDPEKILIGTGKRMRHVKLTLDSKINEYLLETLIEESYKDLKRRLINTDYV